MGVKYNREYSDIIKDIMNGVREIEGFYSFLEINDGEWLCLDEIEQIECIKTMSDDIFYALGETDILYIGNGIIKYEGINNVIKIYDVKNCVFIVKLV